jgi:hypothetical protein
MSNARVRHRRRHRHESAQARVLRLLGAMHYRVPPGHWIPPQNIPKLDQSYRRHLATGRRLSEIIARFKNPNPVPSCVALAPGERVVISRPSDLTIPMVQEEKA